MVIAVSFRRELAGSDGFRTRAESTSPALHFALGLADAEVAKALDYVHGQKYLHRDVKPENILFDRYVERVPDRLPGSSKMLGRRRMGTTPEQRDDCGGVSLMGLPNYVAPEVVMGGSLDSLDRSVISLAMAVLETSRGRIRWKVRRPPRLSSTRRKPGPGR